MTKKPPDIDGCWVATGAELGGVQPGGSLVGPGASIAEGHVPLRHRWRVDGRQQQRLSTDSRYRAGSRSQ